MRAYQEMIDRAELFFLHERGNSVPLKAYEGIDGRSLLVSSPSCSLALLLGAEH